MTRLYILLKQTLDDCRVCARERMDNVAIIEAGGDEKRQIHIEAKDVKNRVLDLSDKGDVILLVQKMNTLLASSGVTLTALIGIEKMVMKT